MLLLAFAWLFWVGHHLAGWVGVALVLLLFLYTTWRYREC